MRYFSQWYPGKMWVPRSIKEIDVNKVYDSLLCRSIVEHRELLAEHYNIQDTSPRAIKNFFIHKFSSERKAVVDARMSAPKIFCPTEIYNKFLRELYRPSSSFSFKKVLKAIEVLPYPAGRYIAPQHLEDLLSKLSNDRADPLSYIKVIDMMEASALTLSSRELARVILILAQKSKYTEYASMLHQRFWSWRDRFQASKDISVYNTLLSAAYRGQAFYIKDFVEEQMKQLQLLPNRITYIQQMKHASHWPLTVQSLYDEFVKSGLAVDSIVVTLLIHSLLQSGNSAQAVSILNKVLQAFPNTRALEGSVKLAQSKLLVIDEINRTVCREIKDQKCGRPHIASISHDHNTLEKIPRTLTEGSFLVVPDVQMFLPFLKVMVRQKKITKLFDFLITMANQGLYPPREVFYKLFSDCQEQRWPQNECDKLICLLCDIASQANPALISISLAKHVDRVYKEYDTNKNIVKFLLDAQRKQNSSVCT